MIENKDLYELHPHRDGYWFEYDSIENGFIIMTPCKNCVVPEKDDVYVFDSKESLFNEYVDFCFKESIELLDHKSSKTLSYGELADLCLSKGYKLNAKSELSYLKSYNKIMYDKLYEYLKSHRNPYWFSRIVYDGKPYFLIYENLNKKGLDGNWLSLLNKSYRLCEEYRTSELVVHLPKSKHTIPWIDLKSLERMEPRPRMSMFSPEMWSYEGRGEF